MKTYFPTHNQNRMKNEGNVEAAREYFLTGKNRVLYHLIKERFSWMNEYIRPTDEVIVELGCGAGLSEFFIKTDKLIMTDIVEHEWVDKCIDAMNIEYPDESIDVIICSHMIHHISNPACFLDNLARKLKPNGRILIQDIYTCSLMKAVLRIMRHEGWSDIVDVYDRNAVCNEPNDPWSANCSIPKLLFFTGGGYKFEQQFPMYKILEKKKCECFLFLLSGGVIAKTFNVPIKDKGVNIVKKIDKILVKTFPSLFACGCSIVLEKK